MMRETAAKSEEFNQELRDHQQQKLVRFVRFLGLFDQSIKKGIELYTSYCGAHDNRH